MALKSKITALMLVASMAFAIIAASASAQAQSANSRPHGIVVCGYKKCGVSPPKCHKHRKHGKCHKQKPRKPKKPPCIVTGGISVNGNCVHQPNPVPGDECTLLIHSNKYPGGIPCGTIPDDGPECMYMQIEPPLSCDSNGNVIIPLTMSGMYVLPKGGKGPPETLTCGAALAPSNDSLTVVFYAENGSFANQVFQGKEPKMSRFYCDTYVPCPGAVAGDTDIVWAIVYDHTTGKFAESEHIAFQVP